MKDHEIALWVLAGLGVFIVIMTLIITTHISTKACILESGKMRSGSCYINR